MTRKSCSVRDVHAHRHQDQEKKADPERPQFDVFALILGSLDERPEEQHERHSHFQTEERDCVCQHQNNQYDSFRFQFGTRSPAISSLNAVSKGVVLCITALRRDRAARSIPSGPAACRRS